MNAPLPRIIGAGALLAMVCLGTEYLRYRGGATKDITLPETSLQTMPGQFGSWSWDGKETKVDERLLRVISADEVVSRMYTNSVGKVLTMHVAVFGDYFRGVPHPPTVCYPSSGWIQTNEKEVILEAPGAPPAPTRVITYDQAGERVLVMFWFQLGDHVFTDDQGLNDARRVLRQNATWPAIVKVLLQTKITNPEQDEQRLKDFGARLYAWTSQLQNDRTPAPSTDSDEEAPAAAAQAE
ncbi:MAG: EpsI family protein [Planctomycetia bacterium]|nr:EpsI family protein [Planctomycetia bacterium]